MKSHNWCFWENHEELKYSPWTKACNLWLGKLVKAEKGWWQEGRDSSLWAVFDNIHVYRSSTHHSDILCDRSIRNWKYPISKLHVVQLTKKTSYLATQHTTESVGSPGELVADWVLLCLESFTLHITRPEKDPNSKSEAQFTFMRS
jgi:hypothetical protein